MSDERRGQSQMSEPDRKARLRRAWLCANQLVEELAALGACISPIEVRGPVYLHRVEMLSYQANNVARDIDKWYITTVEEPDDEDAK